MSELTFKKENSLCFALGLSSLYLGVNMHIYDMQIEYCFAALGLIISFLGLEKYLCEYQLTLDKILLHIFVTVGISLSAVYLPNENLTFANYILGAISVLLSIIFYSHRMISEKIGPADIVMAIFIPPISLWTSSVMYFYWEHPIQMALPLLTAMPSFSYFALMTKKPIMYILPAFGVVCISLFAWQGLDVYSGINVVLGGAVLFSSLAIIIYCYENSLDRDEEFKSLLDYSEPGDLNRDVIIELDFKIGRRESLTLDEAKFLDNVIKCRTESGRREYVVRYIKSFRDVYNEMINNAEETNQRALHEIGHISGRQQEEFVTKKECEEILKRISALEETLKGKTTHIQEDNQIIL